LQEVPRTLRYKVITLLHTRLLTGLPLPVMAFIFHSTRDTTQWDLFKWHPP